MTIIAVIASMIIKNVLSPRLLLDNSITIKLRSRNFGSGTHGTDVVPHDKLFAPLIYNIRSPPGAKIFYQVNKFSVKMLKLFASSKNRVHKRIFSRHNS